MFESNISAKDLTLLARDAADIAPDVSDEYYLLWLNSLEGTLYTGVIRELGRASCTVCGEDGTYVLLSEISVPQTQSPPRLCDVERVLADGEELVRTDAGSAAVFSDKSMFYADAEKLRLIRVSGIPQTVSVIYRVRPALKTQENMAALNVALPDEFVPMALDYLIGNAYALADEDAQAAKWLERYNLALSDFEQWLAATGKRFGGTVLK